MKIVITKIIFAARIHSTDQRSPGLQHHLSLQQFQTLQAAAVVADLLEDF